jgi:predicted TIM-barrel fold metal-dependent hydrolase
VVSTDDHVVEPGDIWQTRLPAKLRDRGPRLVSLDDRDAWEFRGERRDITGLAAAAGQRFEDYSPKAVRMADMRPGCYDAKERLADMDLDGVDAQVMFGTMAGLAGGTFIDLGNEDPELALACIRAYNDWLVDEWCAEDSARLIAQCILPLWDLEESAREAQRCLAKGHRAVLVPGLPHFFGVAPLSDPSWDPLWRVCEDADAPVALHIGGSLSRQQTGEILGALQPGAGVPGEVLVASTPLSNFGVFANLIFSGVPARYPKLKLISVESGIGWVPYFLERMDWTYDRHRFWTKSALTERPSTYFRRQMYATFLVDDAGIDAIERCGVENVMWESDYPHTDTTWPNSRAVIDEHLGKLPELERHLVVAGNAVRVYGLERDVG